MEEKLRRLMKHEGINSTRLAEILGIQASGISHIMSGRNKPSFDFLLKLLQRFPQISPDWLLLDKGPMYRDEIKNSKVASSNAVSAPPAHPVSLPAQPAMASLFGASASTSPSEPDNDDIIPANQPQASPQAVIPTRQPAQAGSMASPLIVERIVLFFNDKTFAEYHPEVAP